MPKVQAVVGPLDVKDHAKWSKLSKKADPGNIRRILISAYVVIKKKKKRNIEYRFLPIEMIVVGKNPGTPVAFA